MPREGGTAARGYGSEHVAARLRWLQLLAEVGSLPCTRCRRPVVHGQDVHLDHNDSRTGYLGLAHARCNRLAGASKGGRIIASRKRRRASRTSRDWW